MKEPIARDCGMTAEQAFQESYLADQYRASGNPEFQQRAEVIERNLEARSIPLNQATELKPGEEVNPGNPFH